MGAGILPLLSRADIALGRLDGVVKVIPDPNFFVGMYVRREAVLGSQIEGTQSSLEDLLVAEVEPEARARAGSDVGDIVNYVGGMNYGLASPRASARSVSVRGGVCSKLARPQLRASA
jgi:Fic family protein